MCSQYSWIRVTSDPRTAETDNETQVPIDSRSVRSQQTASDAAFMCWRSARRAADTGRRWLCAQAAAPAWWTGSR